jgi:hypothetical protein
MLKTNTIATFPSSTVIDTALALMVEGSGFLLFGLVIVDTTLPDVCVYSAGAKELSCLSKLKQAVGSDSVVLISLLEYAVVKSTPKPSMCRIASAVKSTEKLEFINVRLPGKISLVAFCSHLSLTCSTWDTLTLSEGKLRNAATPPERLEFSAFASIPRRNNGRKVVWIFKERCGFVRLAKGSFKPPNCIGVTVCLELQPH